MRDLTEHNITQAVNDTFETTPDLRLKSVMQSLVKHLHAFVRDIEPTEDEWMKGIEFLTRTGKMCSDVRQEFILLSDTLGVTMLVDAINHRFPGVTENSVLGPFYFDNRPTHENGSDISGGLKGDPLYFSGTVSDAHGAPLADTLVDVWHSDSEGHYDVMKPGLEGTAMRAVFKTGADGKFNFWSILPASYPIPMDGPVGDMLKASRRSEMRPAHMHVMIAKPGYERLTTMVFVEGDEYLDKDAVFGVKHSLIKPYIRHEAGAAPDGSRRDAPFYTCDYAFGLAPKHAA